MLLDNLFFIEDWKTKEDDILSNIRIDKRHEVFQGHFPGQPVLPGVTMIQLSKELMEKHLGFSLKLNKSKQVKFLHVINPEENDKIKAEIKFLDSEKEQEYIVNASLFSVEGNPVFKMQAVFEKID
ncbi:MAG TPA: hypothetical protein VK027_00005 [Chitinophagaceae bacterium]|nr:hypothetical protein [Chitinophagaceae bacterium]